MPLIMNGGSIAQSSVLSGMANQWSFVLVYNITIAMSLQRQRVLYTCIRSIINVYNHQLFSSLSILTQYHLVLSICMQHGCCVRDWGFAPCRRQIAQLRLGTQTRDRRDAVINNQLW